MVKANIQVIISAHLGYLGLGFHLFLITSAYFCLFWLNIFLYSLFKHTLKKMWPGKTFSYREARGQHFAKKLNCGLFDTKK